jgi:hypothetical protein
MTGSESGTKMIRFRLGLIASFVLGAVGCIKVTDLLPPQSPTVVAGTYQLVSINDASLPAVMPGSTTQVHADVLSLGADGSFSRITTSRLAGACCNEDSNASGLFTVTNGVLTLTNTSGEAIPGLITSFSLTLKYTNGAGTWRYRKG